MGIFTEVDVAKDHPIWKVTKPTQISKCIGSALLVFKYRPTSVSWERQKYDNLLATFLHLEIEDPESPSFGWAPPEWQSHLGSVLIVRADQKPITLNQTEAICEYSFQHLQSQFEGCIRIRIPGIAAKVFQVDQQKILSKILCEIQGRERLY
jgi:hypothetical protein